MERQTQALGWRHNSAREFVALLVVRVEGELSELGRAKLSAAPELLDTMTTLRKLVALPWLLFQSTDRLADAESIGAHAPQCCLRCCSTGSATLVARCVHSKAPERGDELFARPIRSLFAPSDAKRKA